MNIGITGASGYVGQFIVRYFLDHGYKVRAMSRSGRKSGLFPFAAGSNFEWVAGDMADRSVLSKFVRGLNAIVHCAYDHLPGRYRGGEGENLSRYLDSNLNSTLLLMQVAHSAAVDKFVFISSRAVYATGCLRGSLYEHQAVRPDTFYGAYKSAVEAMVCAWAQQRQWHAVSLRLTGVYGVVNPLERSKWYDIARAVVSGEPYTQTRVATEVHGEDVARAVELVLSEEDARGRAVNCSDRLVSYREVAEILQSMLGTRSPLPPEPREEPPAVMDCAYLQGKGFKFGGAERLRHSLRLLAEAVKLEQRLYH
ncbi:NAD-dependent epimerase/dehydratase family protein [Microbulbifer sp. CnH-101-G]|uniref:NAD-dependent epimerase/dehydratase family protein n=1 Tax=Microbulbifer sp. CnH-101-G TaxID=3243393 RepID=UPI0040395F84